MCIFETLTFLGNGTNKQIENANGECWGIPIHGSFVMSGKVVTGSLIFPTDAMQNADPDDLVCYYIDMSPDVHSYLGKALSDLTVEEVMTAMKMDSNDYGCIEWSNCQWTPFSWDSGGQCNPNGGPFHGTTYVFTSEGIKKTGYDQAYLEQCCTGQFTGNEQTLKCDPSWRPEDPSGVCQAILKTQCTGVSSCGKARLLDYDPDSSSDYWYCANWYENVKTTGSSHPDYSTVQAMIEDFCQGDGSASGECACHNFVANLVANGVDPKGALGTSTASVATTTSTPIPIVGVGSGTNRNAMQRLDVYCIPDPSGESKTSKFKEAYPNIQATYCPSSTSDASSSVTPVTPAPGLLGLPVHCWNPDCQTTSNGCLFLDPELDAIPCPSICAAVSSNNSIDIGSETVSGAIMINNLVVSCDAGGGGVTPDAGLSPFMVQNSSGGIEFEFCQAPNTTQTYTITLLNQANDKYWSTMGDISYVTFCDLTPALTVTQNATGVLKNNGSVELTLTLDTSNLTLGTSVLATLTIADASDANPSLRVPIQIEVDTTCGSTSSIRLAAHKDESNLVNTKRTFGCWWIVLLAIVVCVAFGYWYWTCHNEKSKHFPRLEKRTPIEYTSSSSWNGTFG